MAKGYRNKDREVDRALVTEVLQLAQVPSMPPKFQKSHDGRSWWNKGQRGSCAASKGWHRLPCSLAREP